MRIPNQFLARVCEFEFPVSLSSLPDQMVHPATRVTHPLFETFLAHLFELISSDTFSGLISCLLVLDDKHQAKWLVAGDYEFANASSQQVSCLSNKRGEELVLSGFFAGQQHVGELDGSGVVLLQYANDHAYTPLLSGASWFGESPQEQVFRHRYFYPLARGRLSAPVLFLLEGQNVEPAPGLVATFGADEPLVIYEDEDIVVVNKPSGMLSVPGKTIQDSILYRLQQRYPDASGALILHRLDMSTSGLLLAAKNEQAHYNLHKQFEQRDVFKRYVAVLDGCLQQDEGEVVFPLRVDLDDRPRQQRCLQYGKSATTRWRVLSREENTTRVEFVPVTGRTHQLRVHAAHVCGLDAPIVGDELYGRSAQRLLLHAEELRFTHPVTGKLMIVRAEAPF